MTAGRFLGAMVAAQVLAQIGAFILPALLPGHIARWNLSGTEAGWLIGGYFLGYVAAVPLLVAWTDRVPARRVYLLGTALTALSHLGFALLAEGFWGAFALRLLAGVGWAGCYMPGLKVIADRLEGPAQSRGVSWHAAGVGIAGAASFGVAGALEAVAGPAAAFLFGAVAAAAAGVIGACVMPRAAPAAAAVAPTALLDFRPVLRNRAAMAWIAGYTVHSWEMAAQRAWGVTFLAAVAATHGAPGWWPGPNLLLTLAGLIGIAVSVAGNESAQRYGRGRVVAAAMGAAAILAVLAGASAMVSAPLAALALLAWTAAIWLDSAALTAGTVAAAAPGLRGATMGLHSMCGYAGGFLGPVGVGVALDLGGGGGLGWGLAFGHLAVVTLAGFYVLRRLARPR